MAWPQDLTTLLKRISTPAEEVFKGLRVLGDYTKERIDAKVDTHETALKAYLRLLGQCGEVFVVNGVDGVGSNSNAGTAAAPFLTIKYALSQCVANRNDHILVQDYWQPTGEAWPILVNKNQVHIVGLAQRGLPYPAIHPTGDTAAFQLGSSGQYGSIEKLTIGGGTVGGGIDFCGDSAGQVDGFLIKKCTFGHAWFGTPVSGILQKVDATRGGYGNRIEKCLFLGNGANMAKGAISGNGIDFLCAGSAATMMYGTEIVDNIFMGLNVGINLARASDSLITGNKFTVDDASDGEAITLSALCLGGLISGNEAMEGAVGMTKNPYKDLGTNHWGLNYKAGVITMPATS